MATSVIKKRSPLRRALTDSPKSPKLTPRSGSGPNTKPVGPRPQTHVDRGPMRKPPGDSKLRAQVKKLEDAVGKRPRSAILANRKKRVLAAIDRMKADTGKTEAEREFSWKTQSRLTKEARNRGWLK